MLEHVALGEGEVGWPGQAEQLLCEIALIRLKHSSPKQMLSSLHLAHLQGFSEENQLVHADFWARLLDSFAFPLLISVAVSSGLFQIQ